MQKPLTYALLLAATLGLAACGDKPEEKAPPAPAAPATQPMSDTTKPAGEAMEEKAAEQPQDAGKAAGETMEEQKQ
ncbi:hypothetical protein SAMN05216201_103257 [Pseudomonas linyingensis]|jgi:outer membrane lipopolysaccharide assembly protein LptE/RlpB|uniref:Lipoprotein n=1 Tax=Pseudomonas linyingensis TaxID=915471 RepID=A0A1H6UZE8_9PSED|nr:hypothetical protein [Pseudomonas linyingensis]SEI96044.1 hypothetical protein SAMN05216201_103257 [Pseudomonas linyingensis]